MRASSDLPPAQPRQLRRLIVICAALALVVSSVMVARAATSGTITFTLTVTRSGKVNQTITFNQLPDRTNGDPNFTVSATASSGLPVSFTASGSCTASGTNGTVIHLTGSGSCTVTAHQAGDSRYNPAPDVSQTFLIVNACVSPTTVKGDFNSTPIPAGRIIWFSGVEKDLGAQGPKDLILNFTNATISFTANSHAYTIPVPNGEVIYTTSAAFASTTFNSATRTWVTTVPFNPPGQPNGPGSGPNGNTFFSGVPFVSPAGGLPGGIKNVTWTMSIGTNQPGAGVRVNWQWGAAVYTTFNTTNYNALNVKPIDGLNPITSGPAQPSSDPAGTPESYKQYVVAGGTGNGGTNYTGTLITAANEKCTPPGQQSAHLLPQRAQTTDDTPALLGLDRSSGGPWTIDSKRPVPQTFHVAVSRIALDEKAIGKTHVPGQGHIQVYLDGLPARAFSRKATAGLLGVSGTSTFQLGLSPGILTTAIGQHSFIVALARNDDVLYRARTVTAPLKVK